MPPPKREASKQSMDDLYMNFYNQYIAKYGPKTAILMLVGKFFEMYDSVNVKTGVSRTNVTEIAEACGSSPEPKPTSDPDWKRIFWGFPEHSLPKFERLLIQANYTVVVITQDRDATERVTGRNVSYVSSPGTYIDPENTNIKSEDRNIVGVLIDSFLNDRGKPMWYIASSAFEITTGKAVSTEDSVAMIDGRPVLDSLEPFWSVYPPVEVVVWSRVSVSESVLRSWFTGFRGPLHLYRIQQTTLPETRCRTEFLHRIYRPDTSLSTAEYLGLERHPFSFECLARLLEFVKDHNPSYLDGLRDHHVWTPEDELLLGNSALEQLAMLPVAKPTECLLYWFQKAYTSGGKRALRQRCLKPICDVEELNIRQNRIAELRTIQSSEIDQNLKGIYDLARLSRKLQMGRGSSGDLLQLLTSYQKILMLLNRTQGTLSESPQRAEFEAHIEGMLSRWSIQRIRECATDHEFAVGPAHPWSTGIRSELDGQEAEWRKMYETMQTMKQKWETQLGEDDSLKMEWKDDAPFTLFTTSKRRATALSVVLKRNKIDLAIQTRGSSSVHVLQTEEIRRINEQAIQLWPLWTTQVAEFWKQEWTAWVPQDDLYDWVHQFDAEYAIARIAEEYGYVRPTYVENDTIAGLSIRDLRHPIVERIHTSTPYIPHSIELGCLVGHQTGDRTPAKAEHGILLYGVNAAGKSSLSKAIGLAVVLAQCGIPVPATEMSIAPYNALFTRILGNDNLWAGMSSFVVEMTEFRSILRSAGPKTLVLGDELCAGTETVSAIAIVVAGIQTLVQKQTQFVFATHLHEMMGMSEIGELPTVRPYHLTVLVDPKSGGKLLYDRQLKEGSGSPMYGLEVCRGLDMDPAFLRRAVDLRKKLEEPAAMKVSRYNAEVPVQQCGVCGSKDALETHHIVPQAAADARGFIQVGKHKNDAGNLVVLCESCHTKHHSGRLHIDGWVQTSAGKELQFRSV